SKNHATGEEEGGLSVAKGLEYSAKYAYLVTGKEIGQGSDSEPLLETSSVKPVSKRMTSHEAHKLLEEGIEERARSLGISPEALRALQSAVDYSFGAPKKPSGPPPMPWMNTENWVRGGQLTKAVLVVRDTK